MKNIGYLYHKDYFKSIDFTYLLDSNIDIKPIIRVIKNKNNAILNIIFTEIIQANPAVNQRFPLEIAYPGLVTGIGINHEAKIEGEFKLGVHFDYTYGVPIVHGSSVKGVLRHYFEYFYLEFIAEKISDEDKEKYSTKEVVQDIIEDIFGSKTNGNNSSKSKSIYNRDIFFDAVIINPDKEDRILASDSITPHLGGPLKDPNPITFLKIASGCTLEFRFKLVDSSINGLRLNAENKKQIFEKILREVGIGAKTNVGYGQFK